MKEKDFTGTQWEFTKERVEKLFPMSPPAPAPDRKQKQNTQSATAGSKNKNEKSPMLHPEARISLMEVHKATVASCFSTSFCLSVLGPGTLQMEPPHYYCLKKSDSPSTSTSSPTLLSQSWSKCFKPQDFPSSVTFPTPKRMKTQSCTTSPPTTNI